MTTPLSQDLRRRIVRAVEKGSSIRQAAARDEVSPSAAVKLIRRVRETGLVTPERIGGHRRPVLEPYQDLLRSLVEAKSGITLSEIQAELRIRGIEVQALSTIHLMLKRMDLTQKKTLRAAEQDRPDVAQQRQRFRVWQRFMDASHFVFLDETGTATNMTRRYGRAPRGQRVVDATPYGHWLTTTFVAGLRERGIIAPLVVDGPMRGEIFRAYVEQMLARALSPGDVVVLDNLAAHKVAGVEEAIRAVGGSILYLPPYSPDLNPIEQLFAKLKALLRKAGARTKEALWTTIGELLDAFSSDECRNYLRNCGYEPV
ncbi:IS630 family transposase [Microvirga tunisiensis]|uniref:IS630 family transposase n=1 Tax=Microvirga tunisiensis TaxID=2108360 RepID=A0A5N7MU91_9HYPH|nr:IS630 family transposase [Microvirga tunisiensis]MPR12644.1 IS630 family transposase [Microvirga tunisiensis]MPR30553.1 IS630 family transposase [Microvirga tunisiensis]